MLELRPVISGYFSLFPVIKRGDSPLRRTTSTSMAQYKLGPMEVPTVRLDHSAPLPCLRRAGVWMSRRVNRRRPVLQVAR